MVVHFNKCFSVYNVINCYYSVLFSMAETNLFLRLAGGGTAHRRASVRTQSYLMTLILFQMVINKQVALVFVFLQLLLEQTD